jgi:hypothetical protein
MKIALAIILTAHGFAHLVGFVVPWRISQMEEMPYKTTVLNRRINLGDTGIRVYGLFWLVLAIAFLLLAITIFFYPHWWQTVSSYVAIASLLLCIISWPDARIGIVLNTLIIILIHYAFRMAWV